MKKVRAHWITNTNCLKDGDHLQTKTAVLAGNDTFLTENITEDRKKFITQSKHDILIK